MTNRATTQLRRPKVDLDVQSTGLAIWTTSRETDDRVKRAAILHSGGRCTPLTEE